MWSACAACLDVDIGKKETYKLGVELREARLAGVVEDKDGVNHDLKSWKRERL